MSEPAGARAYRGKVSAFIGSMRSSGRSISPVALIYIGTPVSLLGILPLMAITGLISDEDIEPAGIAFGLLFGLIFGGSGTLAVYIGLINAMENSLGQSSPFFLRLLQMVWRRASLVSLKASAPYFVLALVIFLLIVIDDGQYTAVQDQIVLASYKPKTKPGDLPVHLPDLVVEIEEDAVVRPVSGPTRTRSRTRASATVVKKKPKKNINKITQRLADAR